MLTIYSEDHAKRDSKSVFQTYVRKLRNLWQKSCAIEFTSALRDGRGYAIDAVSVNAVNVLKITIV